MWESKNINNDPSQWSKLFFASDKHSDHRHFFVEMASIRGVRIIGGCYSSFAKCFNVDHWFPPAWMPKEDHGWYCIGTMHKRTIDIIEIVTIHPYTTFLAVRERMCGGGAVSVGKAHTNNSVAHNIIDKAISDMYSEHFKPWSFHARFLSLPKSTFIPFGLHVLVEYRPSLSNDRREIVWILFHHNTCWIFSAVWPDKDETTILTYLQNRP